MSASPAITNDELSASTPGLPPPTFSIAARGEPPHLPHEAVQFECCMAAVDRDLDKECQALHVDYMRTKEAIVMSNTLSQSQMDYDRRVASNVLETKKDIIQKRYQKLALLLGLPDVSGEKGGIFYYKGCGGPSDTFNFSEEQDFLAQLHGWSTEFRSYPRPLPQQSTLEERLRPRAMRAAPRKFK
ncbi:hypothetical protein FRC08_006044 [Ceratobasidium sp. 394]|nr:hypothetical protein FRC08_006044 [Ceratobasidium sp. 394]